jgi:hypothetical protein
MALIQKGYLGTQGPVFIDDATAGTGKVIIMQGRMTNGVMKLFAVQPAYANILSGFPYSEADCTLGPYTDNQFVINSPPYKQPTNAATNNTYGNVADDWVTGDGAGTTNSNTATTTTTNSNTGNTSSGSTTTSGTTNTTTNTSTGNTNTGTTTTTSTTPVVVSAPTMNEQISAFFGTYWWAVLLIVVALLWKPVIAPALGIRPKRRR